MTQLDNMTAALRAVADVLAEIEAPSMVIGGIAVIAHGAPRTTQDIGVAIAGGVIAVDALLDTFAAAGFEPRVADAAACAAKSQVLLLRHAASAVEVDVSLGWLSFELEAMKRARPLSLAGVTLQVVRPDDLVVYKAVAWRPRDRDDIERLVTLHSDEMDLERARRIVCELVEALDDPERLVAFDQLIARCTTDEP